MLSNFPLFDDQQLHNSFSLVVRTSVSNITWKSPPSLWLGGLCIKFWWVSHITYATYVATLAANPLVRIWFVSCSGWILQMISCWWGKTWPRELPLILYIYSFCILLHHCNPPLQLMISRILILFYLNTVFMTRLGYSPFQIILDILVPSYRFTLPSTWINNLSCWIFRGSSPLIRDTCIFRDSSFFLQLLSTSWPFWSSPYWLQSWTIIHLATLLHNKLCILHTTTQGHKKNGCNKFWSTSQF